MSLQYTSTRGDAAPLDFGDVLLTGLATDGGLYCPTEIPELPPLSADMTYTEVALAVMWPFVEGSIDRESFVSIVNDAYACFRDPAVVPIRELGDGHHLMDLAKGPTLAFKDVALQLVGRLLDRELTVRGRTAMVFAATSGDTGSAAIEALANRSMVSAVVLHPLGRVSDVQRRQMTTVDAPNIRNLAVRGNFDDCQDLVKAAFNDSAVRSEVGLAAVNSINWARVMAQIVYYVVGSLRLGATSGQPVSYSVPTGNFGNVLAGWYAKRMGAPIDQLVVASNRNDVLTRYFETGSLDAFDVVPSLSPSMDIQVSSNFERALWEASGRDGAAVAALLTEFRASGSAEVPTSWNDALAETFDAGRADDDQTLEEIRAVHERLGFLIEPHTAVGTVVARELRRDPSIPMITLATAAPAKFPDAVEKATGVRPPLPTFLSELHDRPEYFVEVGNDLDEILVELRDLADTAQ